MDTSAAYSAEVGLSWKQSIASADTVQCAGQSAKLTTTRQLNRSVCEAKGLEAIVFWMSTAYLYWLQVKFGDLKVSSTRLIYTVLCKDQMPACVQLNPGKEFLINHYYLRCLISD